MEVEGILKHQLILHPDIVAPFAAERHITRYARRDGFSWHLCPAKVAKEGVWLLINGELGYVSLVVADPVTADAIDHAVVETMLTLSLRRYCRIVSVEISERRGFSPKCFFHNRGVS